MKCDAPPAPHDYSVLLLSQAIHQSLLICWIGSSIPTLPIPAQWISCHSLLSQLLSKLVTNPCPLTRSSPLAAPSPLPVLNKLVKIQELLIPCPHPLPIDSLLNTSLLNTSLHLLSPRSTLSQVTPNLFIFQILRLPPLFPIPPLNPLYLTSLQFNRFPPKPNPNLLLLTIHHLRASHTIPSLPGSPLSLKPPTLRVSRLIFSLLSFSCSPL